MQLAGKQEIFDAMGIRVIAMTYDSPEKNLEFSKQSGIDLPILTDDSSKHFRRFGIFNEDFEPGHRFYGIPHPGILLVNDEGKVFSKFAEDDYRDRPEIELVIDAARRMSRR